MSCGGRNRTCASWFKARHHYQQQLPRIVKSALRESNPPCQVGSLEPLPLGQEHVLSAEGEGVEPSRRLSSSRFERGAIANWLALPILKLRGQESNLRTPGSKPGITTNSDDPATNARVPCGSRTRLARLEAWSLCRSAKDTCKGGKGGSRTLKAVKLVPVRAGCHRRLACPAVHQAAAAGIEPASGRLTAAYPYQHGSHRSGVVISDCRFARWCAIARRRI